MRRDARIQGVGLLGGCLVLAACAAPPGNPNGTFHPSDTPATSAPAPLAYSLFGPTDPARIDQPCAPSEAADTFGNRCGRAGRVSFEATEHWTAAPLPCALAPVGAPSQGIEQGACVVGDEVVAAGRCTYCRAIDAGWIFHGRASALLPEQALALLQRLGIAPADGRAPSNADAWRAAFAR